MHFANLLHGLHPHTQERLVSVGGKNKSHIAGHDLVLSAPKACSVLWALSDDTQRHQVLLCHQKAVAETLKWVEEQYAICRRGKGGRIKENVAGVVVASFQHFTSRDLDPQLHTHCYIFNIGQRQDGTWGAILSKPIYNAQKQIGHRYRENLTAQLKALGLQTNHLNETIEISGITRETEIHYSKRRQEILKLAEQSNATTARQFERISLMTRRKKTQMPLAELQKTWKRQAEFLNLSIPAITPEQSEEQHHIITATPRQRLREAVDRIRNLAMEGAAQMPLNSAVKLLRAVYRRLTASIARRQNSHIEQLEHHNEQNTEPQQLLYNQKTRLHQ
ncbi:MULTISPECIES: MobF family relaxase [unclassified Pseudovibrio]|uniref:MobF family relaxase n=1 Tax=unclassified Pseudovibrio TaxID=2627060 RepID=UPI0007AE6F5E|nr:MULTISPECIES: MobF family relaxase [unclassified Pseudovibrio]KZK94447.1 Multifunctional conjugation protein TraI [Pseudovibrio sp. W74]KZL07193.1 Multifunctional conjugation protein TraI [Pseudovibrio sp. Ad14]